jgi:hypothetical protein
VWYFTFSATSKSKKYPGRIHFNKNNGWVSVNLKPAFILVRLAAPKSRITNAQFTVVQKPNQGTLRQRGCNPLSGSFFGSFLEKQKRTIKKRQLKKKYSPQQTGNKTKKR